MACRAHGTSRRTVMSRESKATGRTRGGAAFAPCGLRRHHGSGAADPQEVWGRRGAVRNAGQPLRGGCCGDSWICTEYTEDRAHASCRSELMAAKHRRTRRAGDRHAQRVSPSVVSCTLNRPAPITARPDAFGNAGMCPRGPISCRIGKEKIGEEPWRNRIPDQSTLFLGLLRSAFPSFTCPSNKNVAVQIKTRHVHRGSRLPNPFVNHSRLQDTPF